jgi:hypothetical protein
MQPPPPLPAESPSPLVVIGADNWLYYTETVVQACVPSSVVDRAVAEIEKAKAVVTNTGRGFVYTVVPNKAAVYGDNVTSPTWAGSCAAANSAQLRAGLLAAADSARVEMWAPFLGAAVQLYFKHDTHWNAAGSTLGSELIAAKAAPGVWNTLDRISSPASIRGDLSDLIDVEWVIDYNEVTSTLAGVTPNVTVESIAIAGRPVVSYSSPAAPELSEQTTVFVHDSFGYHFRNKLGPLFETATFLPMFSHPIPDAARPFVTGSDQIVFEVAERNALREFIGTGTAGHLAAALADDYSQTPVTFDRDGSNVLFDIPAGSPGDLRYLIVATDVDDTVIIGDINELDIGPTEGAWPNEITPDATRYGFEIMELSGPLEIPLEPSVAVTGAFIITIE